MMPYREMFGGSTVAASCSAAADMMMVAWAAARSSLNVFEVGWKGS